MNGSSDLVCDPDLGLTKREFFAALAMQGLRASRLDSAVTESEMGRQLWSSSSIAAQSVSDADALIKQLNKIQPTL